MILLKEKKTEQKIKENEERFNQVAENANEWIWEVNAEGLFTYSNRIVEKILGYSAEELVGKKYINELFSSEIKKENKTDILEIFKHKKSFFKLINIIVHKNGILVTMEASGSPVLDDKGELSGYRGVNLDISEHKHFEDALLESERRFRAVFENAGMGISLVDTTGKPVLVNNAMLKILGYTAEEFTGMVFTEFTHPDDVTRDWELFRELMDGHREYYQIEKRYINKEKESCVGHVDSVSYQRFE